MVGGNRGATLHGVCVNNNSIGIELCCHRKNGRIVPTPTAIKTAAPLVKYLMKKYDIPASRVVRHFDVTGKCCPNGYISKKSWAGLHNKLTGDKTEKTKAKKVAIKKSVDELAREVINGKWGNGEERKRKLKAAGYDYTIVQKRVNEMLK